MFWQALIKSRLIINNPGYTSQDITEIIHISHMNILRHLKTVGHMNCYNILVFHKLMEKIVWVSLLTEKKIMHIFFSKSQISDS